MSTIQFTQMGNTEFWRATVPTTVITPNPEQKGKWRTILLKSGESLLTFWAGGDTIDVYRTREHDFSKLT